MLIIIIDVVFLSVVFVQMDNTVTAARHNFDKAEPWLLCLVFNGGKKTACLDQVKQTGLVANERTVMAALILLSVSGSSPIPMVFAADFHPSSMAYGPCSS